MSSKIHTMKLLIILLPLFSILSIDVILCFKAKPCEGNVMQLVKEKDSGSNEEEIRKNLINYCESIKNTDRKKKQLCSFIGTYKDSPTSIINTVVKPLSFSKPPEKVCRDIENFPDICKLEYDAPIDWDELDKQLNTMKIKELREILNKLNDQCKGCTEKSDLIARIRELKPAKKEEL